MCWRACDTPDALVRVAGENEEVRTWADSLEEKAYRTLSEFIRSYRPAVHPRRASEDRRDDVGPPFGTVVAEGKMEIDALSTLELP